MPGDQGLKPVWVRNTYESLLSFTVSIGTCADKMHKCQYEHLYNAPQKIVHAKVKVIGWAQPMGKRINRTVQGHQCGH